MTGQDGNLQGFLREMFTRSSRPGEDGRVCLQELGRLMGMDQGYCMGAIARLRHQGLVEIDEGHVSITNLGYDCIVRSYDRDLDLAELVTAIESLEARVLELELKIDGEVTGFHEELRSLLEEVRTGKADKMGTRRKLWDLSERVLNSTANVTSILDFLRTIWPFMSGC